MPLVPCMLFNHSWLQTSFDKAIEVTPSRIGKERWVPHIYIYIYMYTYMYIHSIYVCVCIYIYIYTFYHSPTEGLC